MIQDRQFHLKESDDQSVPRQSRWHKFLKIMGWKTQDNKPPLSLEEEEFFEPGVANGNGDSRSDALHFNLNNSQAPIEPVEETDTGNELIKFASTENGSSAMANSELENNHYPEEIWEPTPTNETFSVNSKTDNPSTEIDEFRDETEKGNPAILSLQLETDTSEDDDWWEPPATSEDEEGNLVEPPATSEDEEEDLEDDWWEPPASSFSQKISKSAGFFEDDNGKISPLRISSFAALIAAILLGWLIITGNGTAAQAELTYGLLAAAFGTKTVNKFST